MWVSADTALLIDTAIEGRHLSAGRFDPTVLGDVLRAGYDLSFDDSTAVPNGSGQHQPLLSGEGAGRSPSNAIPTGPPS